MSPASLPSKNKPWDMVSAPNADELQDFLAALPGITATSRFFIGYSGGLDSSVLLHLAKTVADQSALGFVAVHVHHGLQADANLWAHHCQTTCQQLEIPFQLLQVKVQPNKGESLEAVAREARYTAIRNIMQPGDVLVTAHHGDDQAETLLLQLLRGSGVKGLASMPRVSDLSPGLLVRPLLEVSRQQMHDYALQHGLQWIEDSSNQDLRFDRNRLRQTIIPLLRKRWPSLHKTLTRSAAHCAETAELIDQLAEMDFHHCLDEAGHGLKITHLLELTENRMRNLLRWWMAKRGLLMPNQATLQRVIDELIPARPDAMPLVAWKDGEIRRYQGLIHLLPKRNAPPVYILRWDGADLQLPDELGVLSCKKSIGGLAASIWQQSKIEVRSRIGGESIRSENGKQIRLKRFYQDQAVPPWERQRIPLVFSNDRLICVIGHWICSDFVVEGDKWGSQIHWHRK